MGYRNLRDIWRFAALVLIGAMALGGISVADDSPWSGSLRPWERPAHEWFASPTGKPSNSGTRESPLDLTTALSGTKGIQPGDVLWLLGGTYGRGGGTLFTSRLEGTGDKPIVVRQYPGERATIDGGIQAEGSHVWFWGFEIGNSNPTRTTPLKDRPAGLNLAAGGVGKRAINLVVHDTGHPGIGFWNQGEGGQVYGCIVYHNGIYDSAAPPSTPQSVRGSGIYAQNVRETVTIQEGIWFRNFATGIQAYGEQGSVKGVRVLGNIAFENGDSDIFCAHLKNPVERLELVGNHTYRARARTGSSVRLGYRGDNGRDVLVQDNYFVSGEDETFSLRRWFDATVTGNTFIGGTIVAHWQLPANPRGVRMSWDRNTYFATSDRAFRLGNFPPCGLATWTTETRFDSESTYLDRYPTGTHYRIQPNLYEPGRAHIVIYNWDLLPSVALDVSAYLKEGDAYAIRDAQNIYGEPILSGRYDGKPLIAPMSGLKIAPPVGETPHLKAFLQHTAPEFAVFVLTSHP